MSENGFLKNNRDGVVLALLATAVLVIFWQTTRFDFINLDDNLYIYTNPAVTRGLTWETFQWAFTAFHSANWHPLTWLSHMLDVKMFGLNPGGHHAVNVVFHLINSVLAFTVFKRLTGCFWKSAIVAVLFAVHPAHVESVAWISERKDVLSTMFWLLTMYAYIRWNEEGSKPSSPYYLATILLFALGLMSKPMLVTLPFVLLLCDFWPLERWKIYDLKCLGLLLAEKIPMFVLSGISAFLTILAQRSAGAVESLDALPIGTRVSNAFVAYAKYVLTLFYPTNLAVWYPYDQTIPFWQIAVSGLFLIGVTAVCVWQTKKRGYLLFGWLWFLGTLVPVIGLVQVGAQSMADRYTYVPFFGLFVMLAWGIGDLMASKKAYYAIFAIAAVALCVVSFRQVAYWQNSETLYRHTLSVTQDNFLIAHNLCHKLALDDRLDEAEPFCAESLRIQPNFSEGHNTTGIIQLKRGQYAEAERSFRKALEISPSFSLGYANVALALAFQKNPDEAEKYLERAVTLNEGKVANDVWISALESLAAAFAEQNNHQKVADNLTRLLAIDPNNARARANLALAFYKMQRFDDAQKLIETALQLDPTKAAPYNTYGLILTALNRKTEAAGLFRKAVEIDPNFAEAAENLKKVTTEK